MEAWKAILIAFGGNAALIGVLAWLAKVLISEWLKRESGDRLVVFSKLHEKRAEALASIHFALYEYVANCKTFTIQAEHADDDGMRELLNELSERSKQFRDIFQYNKLYLNRDLCNKIEKVFKDAQLPSHVFIFHLGAFKGENIPESQFIKEWEKAFILFSEKTPKLLEELETEFRSILGAENFS